MRTPARHMAPGAAVATGCVALTLLVINGTLAWLIEKPVSMGSPPAAMMWLVGLSGAPIVGMLIAARRPGHPYGWLLLSFAIVSALLETTELAALFALQSQHAASGVAVAGALISQTLWGATIGHLPLLLLLFPDGRLPSPKWRWLSRTIVGVTVGGSLTALFIPGELGVVPLQNPVGAPGTLGTVATVAVAAATVALFVSMFPAAGSLFVRRRRATPQLRLQLRWFSYAATLLAIALVVSAFASIASDVVSNAITMVALTAVFGSIAVGVLRYRLYEIDRVISRTVLYSVLTLVVVGVYLLVVTTMTALTSPVTGQSSLAVAASTLTAAAAVRPARRRIQTIVDRRFNRAQYDAQRTADAYRARLRDQLDLETIGADLVATAQSVLQPSGSFLWLRQVGS